jgi:hypothetical protein
MPLCVQPSKVANCINSPQTSLPRPSSS